MWPIRNTMKLTASGVNVGTTDGANIPAPGSGNTKSGWHQIEGNVPTDVGGFWLGLINEGTTRRQYLFDVGVGAAGSETVIVNNLAIQANSSASDLTPPTYVYIPVSMPRNTRVSARFQASDISGTANVTATLVWHTPLFGADYSNAPNVLAYGANVADSGGQEIDPGGVVDTKGSWTSVGSTTSRIHHGLMVSVGVNHDVTVGGEVDFLLDIGIGSNAIASNLGFQVITLSDMTQPQIFGPLSLQIPASSQLQARAQCSSNNATDRVFDIILYGL